MSATPATNIITPLMPYFPLVVVYCQRYVKSTTGIGTLTAMMLPYSLTFIVAWTIFLVAYFTWWVCRSALAQATRTRNSFALVAQTGAGVGFVDAGVFQLALVVIGNAVDAADRQVRCADSYDPGFRKRRHIRCERLAVPPGRHCRRSAHPSRTPAQRLTGQGRTLQMPSVNARDSLAASADAGIVVGLRHRYRPAQKPAGNFARRINPCVAPARATASASQRLI